LTSENDVFGSHLILPKYKIVDCSAFCEVIFFYISPENLLGDFFYSLNAQDQLHKKTAKTLQLEQDRAGFSCQAESCCWPAFSFRQLLVVQIRFHSGDVLLDDAKFALGLLPRYLRAGDST
jgi:hypothetical protein